MAICLCRLLIGLKENNFKKRVMKQYKVKMWIGANKTEILVTAQNSPNAMHIARQLFPSANVISAKSV